LECQRRQLGILLQTTSSTPPPLQRNRFIPLPLTTLSPLSLHISPSEESAPLKCDSWATSNLPSRNSADLVSSPSRIPSRIEINSMTTPSVREQPSPDHSTQKPSHSCQLSRRRPSLHVTIPDTERFIPWLDGHLCDSPLVCTVELPQPPFLLISFPVRHRRGHSTPLSSSQRRCCPRLS
jgi:hypothetical protein